MLANSLLNESNWCVMKAYNKGSEKYTTYFRVQLLEYFVDAVQE